MNIALRDALGALLLCEVPHLQHERKRIKMNICGVQQPSLRRCVRKWDTSMEICKFSQLRELTLLAGGCVCAGKTLIDGAPEVTIQDAMQLKYCRLYPQALIFRFIVLSHLIVPQSPNTDQVQKV